MNIAPFNSEKFSPAIIYCHNFPGSSTEKKEKTPTKKMKVNYKISEENMNLINADGSNKKIWDELTIDPKTHRVSSLNAETQRSRN